MPTLADVSSDMLERLVDKSERGDEGAPAALTPALSECSAFEHLLAAEEPMPGGQEPGGCSTMGGVSASRVPGWHACRPRALAVARLPAGILPVPPPPLTPCPCARCRLQTW